MAGLDPKPPMVPPILPAPMTPILSLSAGGCAHASRGSAEVASSAHAPMRSRLRRPWSTTSSVMIDLQQETPT